MERLTRKNWQNLDPWETCGQDNYCKRGCHEQGGCTKGCIVPRIYARLAAYEDTGLEPEEIADFMKRWEQAVEIGGMLKKYGIDHIWDIIQAEQDGRLVVLPCKVGATVYGHSKAEVFEYKVAVISLATYNWYLRCQNHNSDFWITDADIGKTVFLTREEAEAVLKGGEG